MLIMRLKKTIENKPEVVYCLLQIIAQKILLILLPDK